MKIVSPLKSSSFLNDFKTHTSTSHLFLYISQTLLNQIFSRSTTKVSSSSCVIKISKICLITQKSTLSTTRKLHKRVQRLLWFHVVPRDRNTETRQKTRWPKGHNTPCRCLLLRREDEAVAAGACVTRYAFSCSLLLQ